jgi:multiple sugar transport system permease protein
MLILSTTGSLLAFDQCLLLTTGDRTTPRRALVMVVGRAAFFGFDLGGAAARSVVLLVALDARQFRVRRKDHPTCGPSGWW